MKVNIDCKYLIMKLLIAFTLLVASITLHARIGDNLPKLASDLKVRTTPTGPFLEKMIWRGDPNLINRPLLKALGQNLWEIEATAFVDLNRNLKTVIEISYRKLIGGVINEDEQQKIIFHNSSPQQLLNIANPVITPKNRPEKITITYSNSEQLLELKDKQLLEFEHHWQCLGKTLDELKKKYGDPDKFDNGLHYFSSPDDDKNINWKICVKLWKGADDKQEVAHRVIYDCGAKFTAEEQSWLMLINSNRTGWVWNKQDIFKVNHYDTQAVATSHLKAWVKPLLDQVGIETVEVAKNSGNRL